MADEKNEIRASGSTNQSRPFEAHPGLVSVLNLLTEQGVNGGWLRKLRDETDAALATERNTSYQRGYTDAVHSRDF